jgi:hypothetical protein
MAVQTFPLITAVTINDLEDKYVRVSWFHEIAAGTSGAVTIPAGGTIVLDAFAGGVDALVSTMANSYPTWDSPLTSGGSVVAATLDSVGNYTLSATPSAYPVALIYQYRVSLANVDETKMLGSSQAETSQDVNREASPTFAGLTLNGPVALPKILTPGDPAPGYLALYAKADDKPYTKTSAGVEAALGGGGGAGGAHNDLSGLQGGTTAEYYHLTAAEHTALGGAAPSEAEIDFGTKPVTAKSFTITDASVSAASKIQVSPSSATANGRAGTDDMEWDGLILSASGNVGSINLNVVAVPGPVVGKRKIYYTVR